jgi:hypothetical protein
MHWQYKAAVQRILSLVPGGERVNYLLQRRVTRKLPAGDGQFFLHFGQAIRHVRALAEHGERQVDVIRAYEFGAGWDLIGPLSLFVEAGFSTIDEALYTPDAEQRAQLRKLSLAPRFAGAYTVEELEPNAMEVIART